MKLFTLFFLLISNITLAQLEAGIGPNLGFSVNGFEINSVQMIKPVSPYVNPSVGITSYIFDEDPNARISPYAGLDFDYNIPLVKDFQLDRQIDQKQIEQNARVRFSSIKSNLLVGVMGNTNAESINMYGGLIIGMQNSFFRMQFSDTTFNANDIDFTNFHAKDNSNVSTDVFYNSTISGFWGLEIGWRYFANFFRFDLGTRMELAINSDRNNNANRIPIANLLRMKFGIVIPFDAIPIVFEKNR